MRNRDIVVFDEKGNQLVADAPVPPETKVFDKTADAEYAEFYEHGKGMVWHKMPSTRQLVAAVLVGAAVFAAFTFWVYKDSEKTKKWYREAMEDRLARGCKYYWPGISPDPPEHKDVGCRPVQK